MVHALFLLILRADLFTVAVMSRKGPRRWNQEITGELRQRILEEADPIAFLGRVMNGEPFEIGGEVVHPPLAMRTAVARDLLDKIVPDLKATEVSLGTGSGDEDGKGDAFEQLVGLLGRTAGFDGTRPTTH